MAFKETEHGDSSQTFGLSFPHTQAPSFPMAPLPMQPPAIAQASQSAYPTQRTTASQSADVRAQFVAKQQTPDEEAERVTEHLLTGIGRLYVQSLEQPEDLLVKHRLQQQVHQLLHIRGMMAEVCTLRAKILKPSADCAPSESNLKRAVWLSDDQKVMNNTGDIDRYSASNQRLLMSELMNSSSLASLSNLTSMVLPGAAAFASQQQGVATKAMTNATDTTTNIHVRNESQTHKWTASGIAGPTTPASPFTTHLARTAAMHPYLSFGSGSHLRQPGESLEGGALGLFKSLMHRIPDFCDQLALKKKKSRKVLTLEKLEMLELQFQKNPVWNNELIEWIADRLTIPRSKVYKWNWDRKKKEVSRQEEFAAASQRVPFIPISEQMEDANSQRNSGLVSMAYDTAVREETESELQSESLLSELTNGTASGSLAAKLEGACAADVTAKSITA